MMKIAFDISQTGALKAGCGYFADALARMLPSMGPENHYYFLQSFGDFFFDASMSRRLASHTNHIDTGPFLYNYEAAATFWNAPDIEVSLNNPDIIHSNNFWCPTQIENSRLCYTLYDLHFLDQPDWTTEANRTGCFEGVFRASMVADYIIAISKHSKNHFMDMFPHFPEDRLRVIYPASRFTRTDLPGSCPEALRGILTGQFWLSVGTIEPRKNQKMLAQAYAHYLASGGKMMPLVFAGGAGWKMDDFKEYIEMLGITSQVIMTGYVSDEELIWLYRNCYANLYPSFFEGFGLPVLEGMQFGAATVAADTSSIPELAGDAVILVKPDDLTGWSQALQQLTKEIGMRTRLSEKATMQATLFSWETSVSMLLELYLEVVSRPKR